MNPKYLVPAIIIIGLSILSIIGNSTSDTPIFYGLESCPHCQEQKRILGDNFSKIEYIECSENKIACSNLARVPTWKINGKYYEGIYTYEQILKLR